MTRVEQAIDFIRQLILEKKYDENGFLPPEGELSNMLSLSRITVREAVSTLEVRGFVERVHGRGIRVVDRTPQVMLQVLEDLYAQGSITLNDIMEMRWMMEPQIAGLAAVRVTSENLKEMERLVDYMDSCPKKTEEYLQADFDFHKEIANATENQLLKFVVSSLYGSLLRKSIYASSLSEENAEVQYHYHRKILEALKKGDADQTAQNMREHLEVTERNLKTSIQDS